MIAMENKVLIKMIVLELDTSFDVFVPVNLTIYNVKKLVTKFISEITNFDVNSNYVLINKINSRIYNNNEIVFNTDIRNASEVILMKCG